MSDNNILNIEDLDRDELLNLIGFYNNYVVEYPENHDDGMYPVSIYEFYENEYQKIIDEINNESEILGGSI